MTYISLHNDSPDSKRLSPDDLRSRIVAIPLNTSWDAIVAAMDDDVREQVHTQVCRGEILEGDRSEFLARYLELADEPLIIG